MPRQHPSREQPVPEALLAIAREVLRTNADEVVLERRSEGLEVCYMFGNTGMGGVWPSSDEAEELYSFLWDTAEAESRGRSRVQVVVDGREFTLRIKTYDSFGDLCFRVAFRVADAGRKPASRAIDLRRGDTARLAQKKKRD